MARPAIVRAMFDPPETDRRLGDIAREGTVCEVDGKRCRVEISPGFETDWLPMPMGRAGKVRIWSQFTKGEGVLLICPDGDLEAARIACSLPCDAFPAPDDPTKIQVLVDDGASLVYDPTAHALDLDATEAGSMSLKAGGCEISMSGGQLTLRASNIAAVQA